MGPQPLFNASVGVDITSSGQEHELIQKRFGLRSVSKLMTATGDAAQFFVNGIPLQIRGGGWTPDMFVRNDAARTRMQLEMARDMGLNAVRLEGKMESEAFFDAADELGLLVMPGWCCCDSWQHWKYWGPEQYEVARESLRSQVQRLAIHPSVLVFLYASDQLPPPEVETMYLAVFDAEMWPNALLSSASATTSNITGPTGVKMSGPYAWVPPLYWSADSTQQFQDLGGAWGFLTEGGPGAAPMTYGSWSRTVPAEHLWNETDGPLGSWFDYHCGNPKGLFYSLHFFVPPLTARYGTINTSLWWPPRDAAKGFLYMAQAAAYEGIRAMFDAYHRNKHQDATGVIQWMLNNAWPSHIWHLYDYYLVGGGGYYGAKKALGDTDGFSLSFRYSDGSVALVRSLFDTFSHRLELTSEIVALNGTVLWRRRASVAAVPGDGVVPIPELAINTTAVNRWFAADTAYFVRLSWRTAANSTAMGPLRTNWYWLSPTMDIINWTDSTFYRTGCSQLANFSSLLSLQPVRLNVTYHRGRHNLTAVVTNPIDTGSVAFLVSLRAVDGLTTHDVGGALFSDNYFSLLPGESLAVDVALPKDRDAQTVQIEVDCWNNVVPRCASP